MLFSGTHPPNEAGKPLRPLAGLWGPSPAGDARVPSGVLTVRACSAAGSKWALPLVCPATTAADRPDFMSVLCRPIPVPTRPIKQILPLGRLLCRIEWLRKIFRNSGAFKEPEGLTADGSLETSVVAPREGFPSTTCQVTYAAVVPHPVQRHRRKGSSPLQADRCD